MELKFFSHFKQSDKEEAVSKLIKESSPNQAFFLMVILSVLMATFGLIQNNSAILIGSMLIAPVLYPVLGLSMGLVVADSSLVTRSFMTLGKSFLYAVVASFLVSFLFSIDSPEKHISLYFIQPSVISFAVAIISGLAASFAVARSEINDKFSGVAVSVSLVPPMATIGMGISLVSLSIALDAFMLLLLNVVGIIFASLLVFFLMSFYATRSTIKQEVKKDEKAIEKDKIVESTTEKTS